MINILSIGFIPGMMVGFEWDYENKFVVLDLLIIRIVYDYWPYRGKETKGEDQNGVD